MTPDNAEMLGRWLGDVCAWLATDDEIMRQFHDYLIDRNKMSFDNPVSIDTMRYAFSSLAEFPFVVVRAG